MLKQVLYNLLVFWKTTVLLRKEDILLFLLPTDILGTTPNYPFFLMEIKYKKYTVEQ